MVGGRSRPALPASAVVSTGDGTFLSRDAVENEPPYQYVQGNVVNWVDPSGFLPNCTPDKPCRIILGAKKIGDSGNGTPLSPFPYSHAFILVVDPNRRVYPGLGAPPPPLFDPTWDPSHQLPNFITEPSTVYYFRDGPDNQPNRLSLSGYLETHYGYYEAKNPDGTQNLDYLPLRVKYAQIKETNRCADTLRCLKNIMTLVDALQIPYRAFGRNSNTTVATALRQCGLPANKPASISDSLPSWDKLIDFAPTPVPVPVPTPTSPHISLTPPEIATPLPPGSVEPTPAPVRIPGPPSLDNSR